MSRKGVLSNPFVWAFFAGIITLTLIRPLLRREPPPPPVIGRLPAFSLVDTDARPFGSAELAGQVYVANFFFTRCTSICPLLTRRMKSLQQAYDRAGIEDIRLVSITVDPQYDQPDRLRDYAAAHDADPARWKFLTGEMQVIEDLVVSGFKTALGDPVSTAGSPFDIAHSGKLVLVDGSGGIRGYYDSDESGLDEVFHRSQHVVRQQQRE